MQGYITLATGSRPYLEMAVNLALSVKLNDPARPICLVTDRTMDIPNAYRGLFDDIVFLEPKPGFHGCLNKLRMNEVSPYDETMFIDADCIIVKNDMDRHWKKYQSPGFSIAGSKMTQGKWYGFSFSEVLTRLNIRYMVQMNSGVFYFRKGEASDQFFSTAIKLVDEQKGLLGTLHRNNLQLADEPFIGATFGLLRIDPIGYQAAEGTIMITTWRYSNARFDPFTHESTITRHAQYWLFGRLFPRKSVVHSPSIAHFLKLKPSNIYQSISDRLRKNFGIDRFLF